MKLLTAMLDLLFPRKAVCMSCGSMLGCEHNDICEECRRKLAENWIGARQLPKRTVLDAAVFAYSYPGPAGALVRRMKYGSVKVLSEEMGKSIAAACDMLRLKHVDVVTAAPMHRARIKRRGFNHAELLARAVAKEKDIPYQELLYRKRNVKQQAVLKKSERLKNLQNVFAVIPEKAEWVSGKRILLIDDVLTTGATAVTCAATLKEHGADKVYFAAYAYSGGK